MATNEEALPRVLVKGEEDIEIFINLTYSLIFDCFYSLTDYQYFVQIVIVAIIMYYIYIYVYISITLIRLCISQNKTSFLLLFLSTVLSAIAVSIGTQSLRNEDVLSDTKLYK